MVTRRIKIYADGADLETMKRLAPDVAGFTTNPSLLKKSGVTSYERFAREAIAVAEGKPISLEVLADDGPEMLRQAYVIAGWGDNVYVKIPVVNSRGQSTAGVIGNLAQSGVHVNVTAVMTEKQIKSIHECWPLKDNERHIISVFAGRIADSGKNPEEVLDAAHNWFGSPVLLWASARQAYSIIEAQDLCDIITLTPELIAKVKQFGRNLDQYSVETVKQFVKDAEGITF